MPTGSPKAPAVRGPAARRAKRAAFTGERLAKYLANAGAWYYERYMPSVAKLRRWLGRRSNGDAAAVESAVAALSPLLCEKAILDAKARSFLERGKSRRFAEGKLRLAGFTKDDVRAAMETYGGEFSSWETYLPAARRKLKALAERRKTAREATTALFTAFPDFRKEAAALVKESYVSQDDGLALAEAMGAAVRKFGAKTREQKAKVFRKLMARGFPADKIRRLLGESAEGPDGE